jgi:cytochrome c-type biogenesis protein CcmH/NrfG
MSALQAAQRYIEIGRPQQALTALSSLDSEEAASVEAHRLRGFAFLGIEDFGRAADEARDGLEQDPADVGLLYLLASAEEQQFRLAEAESAILAALEQDPDDVELLCRYAEILMRGCELGKAERVLDAAAAAEPDSVVVLGARQSLAYLRGRDREAKRLSRELLAIDPQSVRGHRMLGVYEINRGNAWSAADRFGEAVRDDPTDELYAADAREARRMARNPLWWPTLFFARVGVVTSWVVAVAVIVGLGALGLTSAAAIALVAWWAICIWSWVVPPILNRLNL